VCYNWRSLLEYGNLTLFFGFYCFVRFSTQLMHYQRMQWTITSYTGVTGDCHVADEDGSYDNFTNYCRQSQASSLGLDTVSRTILKDLGVRS